MSNLQDNLLFFIPLIVTIILTVVLLVTQAVLWKDIKMLRYMIMLLLRRELEKSLPDNTADDLSKKGTQEITQTTNSPAPAPVNFAAPVNTISPPKANSCFWKWFCTGENADDNNLSGEYKAVTTWLIRIGIVILLVGLGLLIKLSVERGMFPPQVRVFGMLFLGGVAAAVGFMLARDKYRSFWLTISGGGFALMMLALFGGHHFYNLYSAPVAFTFFVIITLLTIAAAWRQNARIIAVIGCLGGFLSPLILDGSEPACILALGWITVFNAGILHLSYYKRWHFLRIFSLLLSVSAITTFDDYFLAGNYWSYLFAVWLNFILSATPAFIRNSRIVQENPLVFFWHIALALASYLWLALPAAGDIKLEISINAPALSVLAVMLPIGIALLLNRQIPSARDFFTVALAFCGLFLCGYLFGDHETWVFSCSWNLLAILLCVAAAKVKSPKMLVASMMFLIPAAFALPWWTESTGSYPAELLGNLLSFGVFGIAVIIAGGCWKIIHPVKTPSRSLRTGDVFIVLGSLFLFIYSTCEIANALKIYLPEFRLAGISVWWGVIAFILIMCGIHRRNADMRKCAIFIFIFTVIKVVTIDLAVAGDGWRITAFCSLGVLLLLAAVLYIRRKELFQHRNQQ